MFAHTLRAHLALLIAYVVVVSAAPPVDAPPERSFAIDSPPGSHQIVSGSVNYDPTQAANMEETGAFAVLAPGEPINVTHDLPVTYSFAHSEAGDDSVDPPNPFTYVAADDTPKDLHAMTEGIANVKPPRNLVVSRHVRDKRMIGRPRTKVKQTGPQVVRPPPGPPPGFRNCHSSDVYRVNVAHSLAKQYVDRAMAHINRVPNQQHYLHNYQLWFGTYAHSTAVTVRGNLARIQRRLALGGFEFDCACNAANPIDSRRYREGVIKICQGFWGMVEYERAEELLRMAIKFTGTLGRHATNLHDALGLALSNPTQAALNRENYRAYIMGLDETHLDSSSSDDDDDGGPPPYNH